MIPVYQHVVNSNVEEAKLHWLREALRDVFYICMLLPPSGASDICSAPVFFCLNRLSVSVQPPHTFRVEILICRTFKPL